MMSDRIQNLQELLDRSSKLSCIELEPKKEYRGPAIIGRSITIDGKDATIFAQEGPVITIDSNGVCLKNLRVEVTDYTADPIKRRAIDVRAGARVDFENIRVRGRVTGVQEGTWDYPHSLDLGCFPYGKPYFFNVPIMVPVHCEMSSDIDDLEFHPREIDPGAKSIDIEVCAIAPDTSIDGFIYITSGPIRRMISVHGHSVKAVSEYGVIKPAVEEERRSESVESDAYRKPGLSNRGWEPTLKHYDSRLSAAHLKSSSNRFLTSMPDREPARYGTWDVFRDGSILSFVHREMHLAVEINTLNFGTFRLIHQGLCRTIFVDGTSRDSTCLDAGDGLKRGSASVSVAERETTLGNYEFSFDENSVYLINSVSRRQITIAKDSSQLSLIDPGHITQDIWDLVPTLAE